MKSSSDDFYQKVCGARLDPVLNSIILYKKLGIWIEIVTLIIPTMNDSKENFRKIAEFIQRLDAGIPWHVSSFFPTYRLLHLPSTPVETLENAREIGRKVGLKHIYQGNIPGEGENTYCNKCGELLIERHGYEIIQYKIKDSKCPNCSEKINGIW